MVEERDNNSFLDFGLLIIRVGIGVMFMFHGWPKLLGGQQMWAGIGGAMSHIGVTFAPQVWGLLAAASEFFGGLCLVLGIFPRISTAALAFTMVIASTMHLSQGDGLQTASHAIEAGFVFAGLFLTGPGKYRLRLSLK